MSDAARRETALEWGTFQGVLPMRVSRIFVAAPLFLAALLVSRPLAAQLPQTPARYQPAAFHPQPSGLLAPVTNIQPIEAPGAHFRTTLMKEKPGAKMCVL